MCSRDRRLLERHDEYNIMARSSPIKNEADGSWLTKFFPVPLTFSPSFKLTYLLVDKLYVKKNEVVRVVLVVSGDS